jgi:hypothetical protein
MMLFFRRNKPPFLATLYFLLPALIYGCAVTGPYVSDEEIQAAGDELRVKAIKFQIDYLLKVNNIGYKLLAALPADARKGNFIFSGLLLAETDSYLKQLYQLPSQRGVVVIGLVDNGPAKKSGILPGDFIKNVDGLSAYMLSDVAYVFNHKAPGQTVSLSVIRNGAPLKFNFKLAAKPLDVVFRMVDEQEVNAGAGPNIIAVTYGLMRFVKSDDELAVVLGHELAHIARGHHLKGSGIGLISMLAGLAAGLGADKISPGSGDVVMRSISGVFNARFSQDFEREADYFGLQYVHNAGFNIEAGIDVWERFAIEVPQSMTRSFFSTHPSSPERMVRLKRIVQELRSSSGEPKAQ